MPLVRIYRKLMLHEEVLDEEQEKRLAGQLALFCSVPWCDEESTVDFTATAVRNAPE